MLNPPRPRVLALLLLCAAPVLTPAMPPGAGAAGPKSASGVGSLNAILKDGRKVPLFDERTEDTPVARVGEEVVTVRDLAEAIAEAHAAHEPGAPRAAPDASKLIARLVDLNLVVSEAHAMGIQELPEFKASMQRYTDGALKDLLRRQAASRARVDRAKVDKVYREAVREWSVTSVLLEKEADAKALADRLKAGGTLEALGAQAVAEKKANALQQREPLPDAKMQPEVAAVVRKLEQGKVSGVVKVKGGFAILRVDGVRYPESAEARELAEGQVRNAAQQDAVAAYIAGLLKKHTRVDRKLLVTLDYDRKDAPLEKLAKDPRVVAWVDGEKAVTVAQLSDALERKFFHGTKQAAKGKKVNQERQPVLEQLLAERVLLEEARRAGLEGSSELKYLVRQKRSELAFSAALERVILPSVKVEDADVKAFYDKHKADYSYPAMYRLQGLAFASKVGADDAAKKLRSGTDLAWLRANAEGQLDPAKQQLHFGEIPVDAGTMPAGVASALAGTKGGEVRQFAHEGEHYVVRVVDVTAPRPQPLDDVRDAVQQKVRGEKIGAAFKTWVEQLRAHYPVEVLLASVG
jgi:parvulin-like peptidyl-prolyl isomerase